MPADVEIRRAGEADLEAVVALAGRALGWSPDDPNAELFRWKHLDNPVGPSAMWVAHAEGRLVGFRAFMRWTFFDPARGVQRAVRAVDTATDPDVQGRGIFSALTRHGLDELRADGVDFVFNTPNDQSRPGYLKMGWQIVGRVPVAVRLAGPRALWRVARARVPAAKFSAPSTAGEPAAEVLADDDAVAELLERLGRPGSAGGRSVDGRSAGGLATVRTPEFLRWRYAAGPLSYRAALVGSRLADGVVLFRVRGRGQAVELTVCDVLVPGDPAVAAGALTHLLAACRADYAIRVQPTVVAPGGWVALPRQGPLLTWRSLCRPDMPAAGRWSLTLGDIELF